MAVQELNFQGINRAITDYAVTGACEELINLRPTTGGLVPVKDFTVKISGITDDMIFVHNSGDASNVISVQINRVAPAVYFYLQDGVTPPQGKKLIGSIGGGANMSADDISCAALGNYLFFSVRDKTDDVYNNILFLWDGENYLPKEANIPDLSVSVDSPAIEQRVVFTTISETTRADIIQQYESAFNAIQEEDKFYCFGPIIIAIAFKTIDGKTFWTGQWYLYDPINAIDNLSGGPKRTAQDYQTSKVFFDYFDKGYFVRGLDVGIWGAMVELTIHANYWDKDTSIIKSVEVYTSRPQLYLDGDALLNSDAVIEFFNDGGVTGTLFPQKDYKTMNLAGQLLYHQQSIPLRDIFDDYKTVTLEFGGNIQLTNDTLEVDAGAVQRFGKLLAYNARAHFYDSVSKTYLNLPDFSPAPDNTNTISDAFILVTYDNGFNSEMIYVGTKTIPTKTQVVIAPSINIREIITVNLTAGNRWSIRKYNMTSSSTYNYSICSDGPYETEVLSSLPDEYYQLIYNVGVKSFVLQDEPSAINVSAQYNPFVFDVNNSYLAPGKVLDVKPQMVAVKDTSFGEYPLNVFTDRGVYALLQGTGNVLYSFFKSMSNLVSLGNSISTEHGTFFLASGGLWSVAGEHTVLISDALHLGPHKFIRDCNGYQALSEDAYDVSDLVSDTEFEYYIKEAALSYNRFKDELIISNTGYNYSYVLSLKYRQWLKIDKSYYPSDTNGTLALRKLNVFCDSDNIQISTFSSYGASVTVYISKGGAPYVFTVALPYSDFVDGEDFCAALQEAWDEHYGEGSILHGAVFSYTDMGTNTVRITITFPTSLHVNTAKMSGHFTFVYWSTPTQQDTITYELHFKETHSVIDFSEEQDHPVLVHLQSRPFSFNGFGYSHVHRIVDMVRASLGNTDKIIVALYGSDDLQNWNLLSYADRKGSTVTEGGTTTVVPLKVSQIRTPPAARSWRYYTICIGGTIPTDTDFGPVLVDYEPVIRRLG